MALHLCRASISILSKEAIPTSLNYIYLDHCSFKQLNRTYIFIDIYATVSDVTYSMRSITRAVVSSYNVEGKAYESLQIIMFLALAHQFTSFSL